jgi:hypothetical protein
MIAIDMLIGKYLCLLKKASHPDAEMTKHDFKISNLSADTMSGHIHTIEIDADFEYQQVAHTLVLTNEKKHGMYKFISDATIGSHLQALLGDLKCEEESASIAVPVVNSEPSTNVETIGTSEEKPTVEASNNLYNPMAQFVKPKQVS